MQRRLVSQKILSTLCFRPVEGFSSWNILRRLRHVETEVRRRPSSGMRYSSRITRPPMLPAGCHSTIDVNVDLKLRYSSKSRASAPTAGLSHTASALSSQSDSADGRGKHERLRNLISKSQGPVHGESRESAQDVSTYSPRQIRRDVRSYMQLSKAKLSALVVASSAFGFIMAGPAGSGASLLAVSLGTALCSASASALNQIYEVDNDGRMARTRARPLPSGRLTMKASVAFAAASGAAGTAVLVLGCNPLTGILGMSNILLYAGVYTPMKQLSPFNTVVGSVVGAIPPLMGWVAAGGELTDPAAAALFGVLFLWQMPHFYALAWKFRKDYEDGGYHMISRGDSDGSRSAARILGYSGLLCALPVATTAAGVTGVMFAIEGVALGALLMPLAFRFWKERSDENARKVFILSLWYLPLLMALMGFHSTSWKQQEHDPDERAEPLAGIHGDLQLLRQHDEAEHASDMYFRQDVWGSLLASLEMRLRGMPEATAAVRRQLSQACPHELLKPSMRVAIEQQREADERPGMVYDDAQHGEMGSESLHAGDTLSMSIPASAAAMDEDRYKVGEQSRAGVGAAASKQGGQLQRMVAAAATAACPPSVEKDSHRAVAQAAARAVDADPLSDIEVRVNGP